MFYTPWNSQSSGLYAQDGVDALLPDLDVANGHCSLASWNGFSEEHR